VARILVADDEHGICAAFAEFLQREGHEPVLASTGEEALQMVEAQSPAMVFLDVQMPGLTGLEVLARLKDTHPELPVVVMTAYGTMDTALQAVQQGAFDYIGKPVELAQVRKLLQRGLHKSQASAPESTGEEVREEAQTLVGQSAAMQEIFKLISLLTNNDMTVLVMGETGVGKEVVARAIHLHSTRRARPFISVNCAAIVENLAESELFGHEKGSFTGADVEGARPDLFHSLVGVVERVLVEEALNLSGDNQVAAARVIAASNRDLLDLVEKGEFREDLYHRLNLVALRIPPLRQRQSDIPLLAEHFLRQIQVELNKTINGIEPGALQRLQSYSWPGNVREMEHCLKRAALMAPGTTLTEHDLDIPVEPAAGTGRAMAGGMLGLADAARQACGGGQAGPVPLPGGCRGESAGGRGAESQRRQPGGSGQGAGPAPHHPAQEA
jgi:DNA-binding NtrC family response regulator